VNTYNQITNSGFSYDNAGDMTADGVTSYVWNGAALLKTVGSTTYTYDGDAKRVKKSSGTYYWFSPSGSVLAETDTSGTTQNEYIYFGGNRTARRDASSGLVYYYLQDQIGTSRVIATSAGTMCYDADYTPFGQELAYTTTCSQNYKFTGTERDTETANDHTWFRGYEWNLGRWMSPDPLAGDVTNPQSLNRYAYVLNNPTNFVDPLGLRKPKDEPLPGAAAYLGAMGGYGGCTMDGVDTPCSVVSAALQSGAAVQCPNNDCAGVTATQGPGGTTTISTTRTVTINIPGGCVTVTDANGNPSTECTGPSSVTVTVTVMTDVPLPPGVAQALGQAGRIAAPVASPWFPLVWYGASAFIGGGAVAVAAYGPVGMALIMANPVAWGCAANFAEGYLNPLGAYADPCGVAGQMAFGLVWGVSHPNGP
jgi:RHS repeat-associated protein